MQTTVVQSFEVRDFGLAAYLRARGYELAGVRREGPRCVFRFKDRAERRADQEEYFRGEGSIAPLALIEASRQVKSLIHNTT
jgi:Domain of unknown function (DUF5659)